MCKYVVTHGGTAHRDEFLAVGLALHAGLINMDTPVYRRDPTEEELNSIGVLVLDVGGRHDPMRNNFDHHQLSSNQDCAFSLLAKHLRYKGLPYHLLFQGAPWYEATIKIDTLGLIGFAKSLGFETIPHEFKSPVENTIIKSIEGAEFTSFHKEGARLVITTEVNGIMAYRESLATLRDTAVMVKMAPPWDQTYFVRADTTNVRAIEDFRTKAGGDLPVVVFSDSRGPGLCLKRAGDDPRVDFRKLRGDPRMSFVHNNGFFATTKEKLNNEEIKDLIKVSMTL
jgi:hypothetical protein